MQLAKIAEDLRARGYEVTITPSADDVPEFLRGYQPDILARDGREHLVIEIKTSSTAPEDTDGLQAIAERIAQQPGWRFAIIAPPPPEEILPGERLAPLEESEIRHRLIEAETLAGSGHFEAALMLAWAAAEGAMRIIASRERLPLRRSDTLTLLRGLASEGLVNRSHFRQLTDLFRWRSALAHGFRSEPSVPDEKSRAALSALSALTRELLAGQRTSA